MQHSTSVVSIPEIPEAHFLHCVSLAASLNAAYVPPSSSGGTLYIRPVVFGSSAHLGLTTPSEYIFCVYVQPFSTYHGVAPINCLILEDFDRAAERGTGHAKVGGNYAPVIKWMDQARKEGYPITLHLDSKTRSEVDEFSTSGFIGVKKADDGSVTLVVPDSKNVIASVTSESCMELAKSFGWKVEVRPVCLFRSPYYCTYL
jgi:branched-chain amino acid aminotransferase